MIGQDSTHLGKSLITINGSEHSVITIYVRQGIKVTYWSQILEPKLRIPLGVTEEMTKILIRLLVSWMKL